MVGRNLGSWGAGEKAGQMGGDRIVMDFLSLRLSGSRHRGDLPEKGPLEGSVDCVL